MRAQLWSASIRGLTVGGLGRDREEERGRERESHESHNDIGSGSVITVIRELIISAVLVSRTKSRDHDQTHFLKDD